MDDKLNRLLNATRTLVQYIDQNQVFDRMADCGCGGMDAYRSDAFDAAITQAKKALEEFGYEGAGSLDIRQEAALVKSCLMPPKSS